MVTSKSQECGASHLLKKSQNRIVWNIDILAMYFDSANPACGIVDSMSGSNARA